MIIPVVAAVLRDEHGRLLLAQRPEGKHLAGTWEFPGGKLEPDELPEKGLSRELAEELGVVVHESRPLLTLSHHYADRSVCLMMREVDAWQGTPVGLEGQKLQWVSLTDAGSLPMPAADRPIIKALGLDPRLSISPSADEFEHWRDYLSFLAGLFGSGNKFVYIQIGSLDKGRIQEMARSCRRLGSQLGVAWIVDGSPELAEEINADGICLSVDQLRCLEQRPLSTDRTVIARCQTPADLALAGRLGLDLVLVGPVVADASGVPPLGWQGLADLVTESTLPVYAFGGVIAQDLPMARRAGAFGIASDWPLNS